MLLRFNKRTCYISEKEKGLSLTTDTENSIINKGYVKLKNYAMVIKLHFKGEIKEMLYMLIEKITINKAREIESIELNINDNLLIHLNKVGEPNPEGDGSLYS